MEKRAGFPRGSVRASRIGVSEFRRAELDEYPAEMAAHAAREALSEAGLLPTDLDLIINASGGMRHLDLESDHDAMVLGSQICCTDSTSTGWLHLATRQLGKLFIAGTDQCIPDGSVRIQHELGLGESGISCFSVHATCLGFIVALEAAAALLHRPDGKYNNVLICAAEVR